MIDYNLNRIESKFVFLGLFQHVQVHMWIFVTGESNVANLTRLLSFHECLHRAAVCKNPIHILKSKDLVMLK